MAAPNEGTTALPSDASSRYHLGLWDGTNYYAPRADNSTATNLRVALYDTLGNPLLIADDAAFTVGTSRVMPIGALADETGPDSVDEGDIGIPRMTLSRILWAALRAKGTLSADTELIASTAGRLLIAAGVSTAGADGVSNGIGVYHRDDSDGSGPLFVMPVGYNGATWDRQRNNVEGTLLASAARTASVQSADQTNHNARGVVLFLDVTSITDTPSITLSVEMKSPVSGDYDAIATFGAVTATGNRIYAIYAGAVDTMAVSVLEVQGVPLPRTWRINVSHADADSITYSVGYSLVL